jgi:anthranilate synthase component 1
MPALDSTLALITRAIALPKKVLVDLSQLHECNPERYPFLLESVAQGGLGEFDILFAFPQETIQLNALNEQHDFLNQITADFERLKVSVSLNEAALPFTGGWFAYFSYDYAQVVEPVLELPASKFPLAVLTRVPVAVIVKHATQELFIVAEPEYAEEVEQIAADIQRVLLSEFLPPPINIQANASTEEPPQKYLNGIHAIKEYILSGDIFQVNLSRQWQVSLEKEVSALTVYRALRAHNPAPFAALVTFKDQHGQPWHIISSSPERLVKYQAPWVEARPIAGTRKRSDDIKADQALMKELIAHPKERAEHIMLIDLVRNDLGRICQHGTVEVNELMVVETYEHVHHIVSNVRGKLQNDLSPMDILHAVFPGGTITGCPKIRCMEIIAELEQMPREAYTGSLGYINRDGSLDLNILIRTMIQFEQAGVPTVQFRAGGGIVADSIAEHELQEAGHKAKGLINALL